MRSLLLLWALLATAPPAVAQEEPSVRQLGRIIKREKDAVDPALFDVLARKGGRSSFEALEKSLAYLKDGRTREAAYRAFRHFAGDERLAGESFALLRDQVESAKRAEWRAAALRAVLVLAPQQLPAYLESVAGEHTDAACRTIATDHLVPLLGERGGAAALATILDNASLVQDEGIPYVGIDGPVRERVAGTVHREVVRSYLTRHRESALPLYAERLRSEDVGRVWKLVLLRLIAGDADAGAVIADVCRDPDPAVALLAIDLLVERPSFERHEEVLRPLVGSREDSLRRGALLALGRVLKDDPAFEEELLGLARARDVPTRMGAAGALAERRTPRALEALTRLLADPDWSVRVETLGWIAILRPKSAIPALIERLGIEQGRLARDVHGTLVRLTAMDLGRRPEPWAVWWEGEGGAFSVPDEETAKQAHRVRVEREGQTAARAYHRMQVWSDRVVFVLDVSGSMRNPSRSAAGTLETSRMDVAKAELTEVLRRLEDGTLFNVIFFESHLRPLEEKLVKMTDATRAKALRFTREQYAVGETALYPALQLAFDDRLVDTIYLLSDGAPTVGELTDIEEIRAEVARWNSARHVRIHGIAMGQDSTLLHWLCEDTGGTYVKVE